MNRKEKTEKRWKVKNDFWEVGKKCTWHKGGMVLIWFALIGSGDKLCDAVAYDELPLACAPYDTVVP